MKTYLFPDEINRIVTEYRRSEATEDAILADFFANDVDPHIVPIDEHVLSALDAMTDAFKPPRPALPCHLNDVEHHYPFKWQVNAEPPFSTDDYFLSQRSKYYEFYDPEKGSFTKYVDPVDADTRYLWRLEKGSNLLDELTPPKFGFMKTTIFAWTRRWHHIIKSGFTDLAGLLPTDPYLLARFIFPMLLHTKTAIVKKDDPNKMRTIWGCSKPWIIADTMFYWEYIAWLKLKPGSSPMLWGYETFTGGWLRLNHVLFSSYMSHSFVTLDWSRFDKRAYFSLIHLIMLRVRTFLDFSQGYVPNKDYPYSKDWTQYKADKLNNLWLWTLENLYHSMIVLPDGSMYSRRYAGIPSGLYITQLLDSWYNYVMIATLLSALGFNPRTCIIKVQGDDSIIRLSVLLPPDVHDFFLLKLQDLATHYFNSVISTTKSEVRNQLNGCEVLSYRHNHGFPYRDEIAMLAQFYHTKAKSPSKDIVMAMCIGFAFASCGNHARVLLVLKSVFDELWDSGHRPSRAGLTIVFGDSPDVVIPQYDLSHFPTVNEIKQYFLETSYQNKFSQARTWPKTYFLNDPCST